MCYPLPIEQGVYTDLYPYTLQNLFITYCRYLEPEIKRGFPLAFLLLYQLSMLSFWSREKLGRNFVSGQEFCQPD